MSSEPVRHAYADPASARVDAAFVAWGWPGWIWGTVCWLGVLLLAYPTTAALYRGEIGPLTPIQWIGQSLLYVFVFFPALVALVYQGGVFFVVLRVTAGGITVGRWFGARQVAYRSSDITTWRFVDRRSRDVPEAKSASRLRIDFSDGSWVRLSRHGWNFPRLEAWLRRWAPAAARPVWRLPDTRPSTYAFVVRDVRAMLVGLTALLNCSILTAMSLILILAPQSHPPSGVGAITPYAKPVVILFLSVFLGPFVAHATLKDVRVDAPRIHVKRWFGLIRRTYREDDIKSWRVTLDPNPPWWREVRESTLALRFTDGGNLVLMGHAANFHALLEYLRARASTRQDVRGSIESGVPASRRLIG